MKVPKLIEEIDRLFDEMVRDPWGRTRPLPAQVRQPDATHLEVRIPLAGAQPSDVTFAIEGRRLNVSIQSRESARASGTQGELTTDRHERVDRSFELPSDTEVASLEARFEGDVLRVCLALRPKRG